MCGGAGAVGPDALAVADDGGGGAVGDVQVGRLGRRSHQRPPRDVATRLQVDGLGAAADEREHARLRNVAQDHSRGDGGSAGVLDHRPEWLEETDAGRHRLLQLASQPRLRLGVMLLDHGHRRRLRGRGRRNAAVQRAGERPRVVRDQLAVLVHRLLVDVQDRVPGRVVGERNGECHRLASRDRRVLHTLDGRARVGVERLVDAQSTLAASGQVGRNR